MIVDIDWQPKSYQLRERICKKYALPCWWTINKKTLNVEITEEIREQLRIGESNGYFRIIHERK